MAATSLRDLAAEASGGTRAQRLYREDGWTWAQEQADALRRRDVDAIDWDNVIEEIEDVGRSEERGWVSHCRQAIEHLLAIEHYEAATDQALSGWVREIQEHRDEMADSIRENPGLKHSCGALFARAWRKARRGAARKLASYDDSGDGGKRRALARDWSRALPRECPYGIEDVAGLDPQRDLGPRRDVDPGDSVWPAGVARVLNERLGRNYPVRVRPAPEMDSGRSR